MITAILKHWRTAFFGGLLVLIAATSAAYSNHFQNDFHFDDWHTVTSNPWIRDWRNLPAFFTDGRTMSSLPANQSYRPLLTASLALDYKLGGGLKQAYFHASTFVVYLALAIVLAGFLARLFQRFATAGAAAAAALLATALFALHPASAETVNYVVQRADVYIAFFLVVALFFFSGWPGLRRFGLYALPIIPAMLFKPTAIMIAPIVAAYSLLIEKAGWKAALRQTAPALVVSAAMMGVIAAKTPASHTTGAASAWGYILTQPRVTLHYFTTFFAPVGLSVDTDRKAVTTALADTAILGYAFLALLLFAIWRAAAKDNLRPIAFGLTWFLLALVPTAVTPLAEVENDHRLFAAFIGLAVAAAWCSYLLFQRFETVATARVRIVAAAILVFMVLGVAVRATYARNEVWRTEESLWLDATRKSPLNGRAHMNYALTQMQKGEFSRALASLHTALAHTPNYPILEINLGVAYGAIGRAAEAERHFRYAESLAPADAMPKFYYARWLNSVGRGAEAVGLLNRALQINNMYTEARDLLASIQTRPVPRTPQGVQVSDAQLTPEGLLEASLRHHRAGQFRECIARARDALKLRPDYAEAYNNIAAGYEGLMMWDEAIEAAESALKIRPDYQLARNNLIYSRQQKAASQRSSD